MKPSVLAIAITVISASNSQACNIPVFRYALERWRPDAIEVVVLRDSELSPEQADQVSALEKQTMDFGGNANAKMVYVNVGSNDPSGQPYRDWWAKESSRNADLSLPHVLVRSSLGRVRRVAIWNGSIQQAASGVLQSPVRKQLATRLLGGHAIVWLLLRGEDETKNTAARERLSASLDTLATRVRLPEGIGLPGSELHSEIPLLLKFSILEIDPNDPQEQFLVQLFRGLIDDADAAEPLVVPVFGRARALEVVPASELTDSLTVDLTIFLCGACSCQVKERNPGFDLLISAAWETEMFGADGVAPPDESDQRRGSGKPKLLEIPPGRE